MLKYVFSPEAFVNIYMDEEAKYNIIFRMQNKYSSSDPVSVVYRPYISQKESPW